MYLDRSVACSEVATEAIGKDVWSTYKQSNRLTCAREDNRISLQEQKSKLIDKMRLGIYSDGDLNGTLPKPKLFQAVEPKTSRTDICKDMDVQKHMEMMNLTFLCLIHMMVLLTKVHIIMIHLSKVQI